jgi:Ca-activated chloride channel family protein
LSSNNPRHLQSSQHGVGDRRGARLRLARLCLLVSLALIASQASLADASAQAAQSPSQQQQQPTPTPASRPRTVNTKDESAPAPPGSSNAQQSGSNDSGQPNVAGSQTAEEVDEDEVVRVVSNLVIIPATVVDARGRAIVDLRVEDFELRVDGEVKSIGDLSRSETPVQVVLLFDNSASLSAAREFEKQAAVRFFQSVVRPIDRAAVYAISTTPTLVQPLTNDVRRLVGTVERFGKPDGATALFDSIAQAADYMRPLTGRKVLVLVSDGTDTVSDTSFDDAVNRALRAECQVYIVQTRQVEDPNLHDTFSEQRMYKLAEQTGGAVYVPRSIEELDTVFTQISLDLSQQYLLSYYPQDNRTDKYFRFINLRVKTRPNMRVRARKGFYPPSATGTQTADSRAQMSTVPQNASNTDQGMSAGVSTSLPSATQRRSAGGNATAANRDNNANRKIGPDGPDDDSVRPKPKADAPDASPTFTLTTVASVTPPKPIATPEPSAAVSPAPTPLASPTPHSPRAPVAMATPNLAPAPALPADSPASRSGNDEASQKGFVEKSANKVVTGKAISLPKPAYPPSARSSGAWGKVVVEVTIDENGKVVEARALSGHPLLQQAAVSAARQAKFAPSLLAGKAVTVKGTISYVFPLP